MPAPEGNEYAVGNDGGRPTKYENEYAKLAYNYCLLGATNDQLATYFDVSLSTIKLWLETKEEFSAAVKNGKTIADAEVAAAYHKRAKGFSYDEVTREGKVPDPDKEADIEAVKNELTITKVVTKMYPPEPGAALNWLKNRQPTLWREGYDINLNKGEDIEIWSADDVVAFQKWKQSQQQQPDGH